MAAESPNPEHLSACWKLRFLSLVRFTQIEVSLCAVALQHFGTCELEPRPAAFAAEAIKQVAKGVDNGLEVLPDQNCPFIDVDRGVDVPSLAIDLSHALVEPTS